MTERLPKNVRRALEVLASGDAFIEGHSTTHMFGRIVNRMTALVLEQDGLASSYETGRISPLWKLTITAEGRAALEEDRERWP